MPAFNDVVSHFSEALFVFLHSSFSVFRVYNLYRSIFKLTGYLFCQLKFTIETFNTFFILVYITQIYVICKVLIFKLS